jgi:hypothetical protein
MTCNVVSLITFTLFSSHKSHGGQALVTPSLTLPYLACSSLISIGNKCNHIKLKHWFGCQFQAMNEDYFTQPFQELIESLCSQLWIQQQNWHLACRNWKTNPSLITIVANVFLSRKTWMSSMRWILHTKDPPKSNIHHILSNKHTNMSNTL